MTWFQRLNPRIQHVFVGSFLFHVFFTSTNLWSSPGYNAAARSTRHRAQERSSESLSEIFITVSISHALFTPCPSEGEKIRGVEAIPQQRKTAGVRVISPIWFTGWCSITTGGFFSKLDPWSGYKGESRSLSQEEYGAFWVGAQQDHLCCERHRNGKKVSFGTIDVKEIGPARLRVAEESEKNSIEVYELGEGGFGRVCCAYRTHYFH